MVLQAQSITVEAPGTVANVGSGFDIFAFAMERPADRVRLCLNDRQEVRIIKNIGRGAEGLPLDAQTNIAGFVLLKLREHLRTDQGFDVTVEKGIPPGSGLGSSAASAVASVLAANILLGEPLSREELIPIAMQGELLASGVAHADNVAPALIGGFILIGGYDPLDIIRLPIPSSLWSAVAHPGIEVRTEDARRILPKEVSLRDAVRQWGNVGGLVATLCLGPLERLGKYTTDYIVEPIRATLIPGFHDVKQAALSAGALGCSISGSGPSVFALCLSQDRATQVAAAMIAAFEKHRLTANGYVSQINPSGARVIDHAAG